MIPVLALLIASLAAPQGIPTDRAYLQFGAAVRVPGATLDPGTYLFVLGMPVGGQAVIDIYSADGSKHLVTCAAVQSRMPRPSGATTIDYPLQPPALRAWFHPANAIGFEFVYSAADAKRLHLQTGLPVPFGPGRIDREMIGAIPIAVAGAPMPDAPSPLGTSGVVAAMIDESDPASHLDAAKRAVTAHLPNVTGVLHPKLVLLAVQLEDLQKARDAKERARRGAALDATLNGLAPVRDSRFSGLPPLDPETASVVERVRVHVKAYMQGVH